MNLFWLCWRPFYKTIWRELREMFKKMFRKQQEERLNVDKGKNKVMIKPHSPGYQERGNKCRQGQGTSRIPPLIAAFEGCGSFQMLSNIPRSPIAVSVSPAWVWHWCPYTQPLSDTSLIKGHKSTPKHIPPSKIWRESELARTGWQMLSAGVVINNKNN